MKTHLSALAARAVAFVLALCAALPALAAPAIPTVHGNATQASAIGEELDVTTSATINAGDLVVVAAASAANQIPLRVESVSGCRFKANGGATPITGDVFASVVVGSGANPIRGSVFYSYATAPCPTGSKLRLWYGGAVGAKAATVVVVAGAEISAALTDPNSVVGNGTAISPGSTGSLGAGQLVLATSIIAGGGADSYTEDAGFTFLNQTAAGAWPAIRMAYKATSGVGAVSYTLTNSSSRTWMSVSAVAR